MSTAYVWTQGNNKPKPVVMQPAYTYPQHARAVLTLGLPLILSHVAQFMINVTDTVMLGWYDVGALAAVTLAGNLYFLVFIVGSGFAFAVTPIVAAAAEEGDETHVRRVTRMGLWLSVIYGLFFTLPFMWAEPILLAMGQEPEVAAGAATYLRIMAWQMIPALIVMTLKSFLSALEYTGIILWATIGTALLNVVVNYALIFGNLGAPEMGIQGAAIASLFITLITVAIILIYALRKLPQYHLLQNIFKRDGVILREVFRLGWPIGLTSLAEGGLFAASAVMMGWLGAVPLAAHGIALQLSAIAFMVHIGFSQAATIRAGRAVGRKDQVGLRRGAITAIIMSLGFAFCTMALFLTLPELLITGFISPNEPERDTVLLIGAALLGVSGLFQIVDAAQVMALGLLRGVQDTAVPMVMAVVSYWIIGMPVSYYLAFIAGYGGVGLWAGLVVGLGLAAISMQLRFWLRSVKIG